MNLFDAYTAPAAYTDDPSAHDCARFARSGRTSAKLRKGGRRGELGFDIER
jgi:hypothetical protein